MLAIKIKCTANSVLKSKVIFETKEKWPYNYKTDDLLKDVQFI